MRIIEILIAVLVVSTLATAPRDAPSSAVLTALILATAFYAYLGFLIFNGIGLRKVFRASSYQGLSIVQIVFSVVCGFVIGLGFCSMLFILYQWPGLEMYRKAYPVFIVGMVGTSFVTYLRGSAVGKRALVRSIPMLLLCIYVFYIR